MGRNQFRNNMGNFRSDPTSLLLLLSLTGLDSPHSLYCNAPAYFTGWKCACVCSSNHSLLLKPPKHYSACSASYTTTTCHHNHYKIPPERLPMYLSSLSLAVASEGPTKYLFVKHLLICETYRFDKIILLLKPVTKNPCRLTIAAESLRALGFTQH